MLKENVEKVLQQIKNGNNLGEEITLVGAIKTVDADIVNQAVSFGLKVVAENKVQEFCQKNDFIKGADKHFIGHLQTNKVKYIVGKVSLIHSVDSFHLAEAINKESKKKNVISNILLEINIGGELSKSGIYKDNILYTIKQVNALENVKVKGLMAMLPKSDDYDYLSGLCRQMRNIYDDLKAKGYDMQFLSMGMSGDYSIAIKNGSNTIRLGSALFGARNYGDK